ncbi:hypothetical protein PanWU01x14_124680 [Parasponia andersonii]|uniref:Uncharacterized protein n=1 Tax=Parasponia andersonii TaxID=3476 RepID=A0A2P5CTM8_PARAD|nr:hypothetical protein PanWU01x14_124680 [Parasponia andersonii]
MKFVKGMASPQQLLLLFSALWSPSAALSALAAPRNSFMFSCFDDALPAHSGIMEDLDLSVADV